VNPTGSSLERAVHCPASHALPRIAETTGATERGNANHEAIEKGIARGDLSELPEAVRTVLTAATDVDVEIAFAIDVQKESVRLLGRRIGRAYGELAPTEIALTIDAVVDRPDGVWVVDWKSRKRVTPAAKNLQLRAGAIAVMVWRKLTRTTTAIGYLDDGEVDAAPVDLFDSAVFFADMRSALERVRKAEALVDKGEAPPVHSGPWCEYCPSVAHCPAKTRLALAMLGELAGIDQQIRELTLEQCGEAWEKLRQIQTLAEKVEDAIKERARMEFIPLRNGKMLAAVECKGRVSIDIDKVRDFYSEHGATVPEKRGASYVQVKETKGKAA